MTMKAKLVGAAIVLFAIAAGVVTWQATAARDRPATPRTEGHRAMPGEDEARTDAEARGAGRTTVTVEDPGTLPDRGIGPPGQRPEMSVSTAVRTTTDPEPPKPYRIAEPCGETDRGALRVIVTDGAGNPLPQAKLLAGLFKGGQISLSNYEADGAGRLELRSLEPGQWSVSALSVGQQRIAVTEVQAGRFTEVAFTLAGGATVEGVVRHVDRGPLEGVRMSFDREDRGFHDYFNATTDAEGRYRIEGVPPGSHRVSLQGSFIGYDDRPRATLVVPGPGTFTEDIVLGRIALSGTVRDADTGAPIAGVTIQFQGPWWGSVATGTDGAYGVPDLASANYKVCLMRDGYGTEFGETGQIPPDGVRTADFSLRRAAVLVLEVLDKDGQSLPGSANLGVAPVGSTSSLGTTIEVDPSGIGRYPKIVPGNYDIGVSQRGYVRQSQRVEVKPGENRLTFRLERDAAEPQGRVSLEGTVRDATTRRPIPGARVSVQEAGFHEAISDAQGVFRLRDVPPGKWTVHVSRDGYGFRSKRDMEFTEASRKEDFDLTPAATLHVHVTDRAGNPVVGRLFLGVRGREETLTNVGTSVDADAEGHGVYRQIVPGRYDLRVLKENVGEAKVEVEIVPGENVVRVRLE